MTTSSIAVEPGAKFGYLTVVRKTGEKKNGSLLWLCECVCGKTRLCIAASLRFGKDKSCGCRRAGWRHGHGHTGRVSPTYQSWARMRSRCTRRDDKAFSNYGGRGITVCERWQEFKNFLADMGERPSLAHSIDRIDNEKGYEPSNCRWATRKTQNRNTRRNHLVTFDGRTQCLSAWAEELNIRYPILVARLNKLRWPIERAFAATPTPRLRS